MPIDINRALTGEADVSGMIPEIMSALVEQVASEKRFMRDIVVLNTELQGGPGKSIEIPKIGGLDAVVMADDKATIDGTVLPVTSVTVNLDRLVAVVDITRDVGQKSKANIYDEATRALGEAIARKEDVYIIEKAIAGAGTTVRVNDAADDDALAATDTLDTDTIKAALEVLQSNNAPEPYYIVIHPHQLAALWGDEQFVNAAKYGGTEPRATGEIPQFLGAKFLTTTNIPHAANAGNVEIYSALALSGRSIVEALGEDITVLKDSMLSAGKMADRLVATMSTGAEVLNAPYTVVVKSA